MLRRHLTRHRQTFFTSSILAENESGLRIYANELREAKRFALANYFLTANDSSINYEAISDGSRNEDDRVE